MRLSRRQQIAAMLGMLRSPGQNRAEAVGHVLSPRQRIAAGIMAMAQLTANLPQVYGEPAETTWYDQPVDAAAVIYQGSAVGLRAATGYARQLVAGDDFLGFSEVLADNSGNGSLFTGFIPGNGQAGNITVNLRTRGQIVLNVSTNGTMNGSVTDRDKLVYASDGATFTDTAGGNTIIGRVVDFLGNVSGVQGAGGLSSYLVKFVAKNEQYS